jgi:uncharacterized membrane protein
MVDHQVMTAAPAPPLPTRTRSATPAQLDWLAAELPRWRAAGLVDDQAATAILAGYHPSRRFDLSRLLLTLGAAFVGVGILWLVASNLDQLPPLVRFVVVAAFWLAFLVGGELLAARREHASSGAGIPSPVVGCVRILAALTFGAVVMQAAQSLQVPAYEPQLLAWWGLGALVHAYAVRGAGPLVVGLLTGASWLVWQTTWDAPSALTVLLVIFAAGTLAAAAAAWHEDLLPAFAAPWREIGALLTLGALFVAALPFVTTEDFAWTPLLVAVVAVCGLAAGASAVLARGELRLEPLLSAVIAVAGVLLVLWDFGSDFDLDDQVGAAGWAHAGLGVVAYVAASAWFAVLGVLRDSRRLTFVATAALVVFTTVQAFSVFAAIVQGAWLFVLLGLVFVATGWLADRARRQLARSLADEEGTNR